MKFGITFLIIIITFFYKATGQDYFFRQYTNEEGLNHSFIYSINQDIDGFLFIGTAEGLYRFNGFEFEYFTTEDGLADNFIVKIFREKSGKLWFGHQNGFISVLSEKRFIVLNEKTEIRGSVTDFTEDDHGLIWVSIQNQDLLFINEDIEITPVSFPNEYELLSQIEYLGNDHFLIGSQENIYLSRYDRPAGSMVILNRIDNYPGSEVVEIFPEFPGSYIVVSQEDGIYRFIFDTLSAEYEFSTIDDNSDGVLDNLQGGILDGNGTLWLNSMGNGLIYYRGDEGNDLSRVGIVSEVNGLVSDNVRSLFEDFEGNLWFGMFGEGLLRYVDNNLRFYSYNPENESNRTYTITGDNGGLLVVIGNRLLRINHTGDTVLNSYPIPLEYPDDHVNSAYLDEDDKLWLGFEQSGLYVSEPSDFRFRAVFISNDDLANSVNHITGSDNQIWIGTKKGICRITRETGETRWFTTDNGLPHNNIQQLYIDSKGRVLVATLCSEIHFINDKDEVERLENSRIGPFNTVVSISEGNNGTIWACTYGNGIWKIVEGGNVNYTRASGLLSDYCYSLALSEKGEIVTGHRGGISKINPETNRINTFSRLEGIKSSSEFYQNSIFADEFGSIWFGTSEGLVKYTSGLSTGGSIPPKLQITSLYVDGEEVERDAGLILLKPGSYELAVDYIGINFTNPEMVIYQTKLEGYNINWSDLTNSRRVVYDRVGHGNYIFQIRAFNENDIGSEISSAFELKIQKPIYLTIWFYAVLIILLSLTFYIIIRLRERNLRTEQERLLKHLDDKTKEVIVKEEIIKERKKVEKELIEARNRAEQSDKLKSSFLANISHEIRTPMNAIIGFSQLLNYNGITEDKRQSFVDLIQTNSNHLLSILDNIIELSNLETGQLKLDIQVCHVNTFLEKIYLENVEILEQTGKNKEIDFSFIPGVKDNSFGINTDQHRLGQILERLLDNSIKYTEKGHIHFGYELNQHEIRFFVTDTGIGLSEEQKEYIFKLFGKAEEKDKEKLYSGTGLGLSISQRLVVLLGGEIGVTSDPGSGSTFYFNLPLTTDE